MIPYHGRHRLFDAKRRDGWSFVRAPGGMWHAQWRGRIKVEMNSEPSLLKTALLRGIDIYGGDDD